MYIKEKVAFIRCFYFIRVKTRFTMSAFIRDLTRINSVGGMFLLFEVSIAAVAIEPSPPPQLIWRKSTNGTNFKVLTTFTLNILLKMNKHIEMLYFYM